MHCEIAVRFRCEAEVWTLKTEQQCNPEKIPKTLSEDLRPIVGLKVHPCTFKQTRQHPCCHELIQRTKTT